MSEDYWNCQLIDLYSRKVIEEKDFLCKDLPLNYKNHPMDYGKNDTTYGFTYLWIVRQFFDDCVIQDCQNKRDEKGFPDFKITSNDLKEIIYLEFKSPKDPISQVQIMWYLNNKEKKHLLLLCEERCDDCENGKENDNGGFTL